MKHVFINVNIRDDLFIYHMLITIFLLFCSYHTIFFSLCSCYSLFFSNNFQIIFFSFRYHHILFFSLCSYKYCLLLYLCFPSFGKETFTFAISGYWVSLVGINSVRARVRVRDLHDLNNINSCHSILCVEKSIALRKRDGHVVVCHSLSISLFLFVFLLLHLLLYSLVHDLGLGGRFVQGSNNSHSVS